MSNNQPYDYGTAGFDNFFNRSIDQDNAQTLEDRPAVASRQMNFDQGQVSGSLGDTLKLGHVTIDGGKGRISVTDDADVENTRIGDLDD